MQNYRVLRVRARGLLFAAARERHVLRAVLGVRRNGMRVGLAHGTRGCDCDARCGLWRGMRRGGVRLALGRTSGSLPCRRPRPRDARRPDGLDGRNARPGHTTHARIGRAAGRRRGAVHSAHEARTLAVEVTSTGRRTPDRRTHLFFLFSRTPKEGPLRRSPDTVALATSSMSSIWVRVCARTDIETKINGCLPPDG